MKVPFNYLGEEFNNNYVNDILKVGKIIKN